MKRVHQQASQHDTKRFKAGEWTKINPSKCAVKGNIYFVNAAKEDWDEKTYEMFDGRTRYHNDGEEMSVCSQFIVWRVPPNLYKKIPMTHREIKKRHDDIDMWQKSGDEPGVYLFFKPVLRFHEQLLDDVSKYLHPAQIVALRPVNKRMSQAQTSCKNLTYHITWSDETNGYVVHPLTKTLDFNGLGNLFSDSSEFCRKLNTHLDTVNVTFHGSATTRVIHYIKNRGRTVNGTFPPIFVSARQVRFWNTLNYDELDYKHERMDWFYMHDAFIKTLMCIAGMEIRYSSLPSLFEHDGYNTLRFGRIVIKGFLDDDIIPFQGNMEKLGLICDDVYIVLNPKANFSHLRNVLHVQKVCTLWDTILDDVLHKPDGTVNNDVAYFIEKAKPMCSNNKWFADVQPPDIP